MNGEPAVTITAINRDAECITITPLFVSLTDSMRVTDHDGSPPSG